MIGDEFENAATRFPVAQGARDQRAVKHYKNVRLKTLDDLVFVRSVTLSNSLKLQLIFSLYKYEKSILV